MSARTLGVAGGVRDDIRRLHPALKRMVRDALADILADPGCGRPLKRTRRLLEPQCRQAPNHLWVRQAGAEIVAVGPRRTIYEDTARSMAPRRGGRRT